MPTGGGGGGVTSASNTQLNSLGVGTAADGTTGDITLAPAGTIRSSSGSFTMNAGNGSIDFNFNNLLRAQWIGLGTNSGSLAQGIRFLAQTFASLPAAAAGNAGNLAVVSDSTTITWGATITGGGANTVLAFSDGAAWTVVGK